MDSRPLPSGAIRSVAHVDLFDIALIVRRLVPTLFAVVLAMTERFEHAIEPILEPTSRPAPATDRDR
jgi:hypothetical protein